MAAELVYELKHPVTIGGETITEVKVGRLKGKYLRALPADPKQFTMGVMMDLAAKVTGLSTVEFDELEAVDVQAICDLVGKRLEGGLQTGGKA